MDNLQIAKQNLKLEDIAIGNKRQIGKRILVNPCPVCGHKGHFYIYPYSNTFSSESRCCNGGSVVDYYVQVYKLDIKKAIDEILSVCGLSRNKKSVNEINALKREIKEKKFKKKNQEKLFNEINNNIILVYKQLNDYKKLEIELQFLKDFLERIYDITIEGYTEKNYKVVTNLTKEFDLSIKEFEKYKNDLKIIRSEFDV